MVNIAAIYYKVSLPGNFLHLVVINNHCALVYNYFFYKLPYLSFHVNQFVKTANNLQTNAEKPALYAYA